MLRLGVNVSDDWNFEQIRATGFNKSAAVRVALHANSLVGKPGEHPISLWDQFSQNNFPRQPTLLSYGTNQAVGFRRQSSQFLDGGSMTLAFSGGMTAIARFKMTGNANSWERIFDFGKGEDNDNVMLTRQFESSKLEFSIRNSNQFVCELVVDNVLVQEEWMTIAVRYDDALNKVDMLKNGNVLANVSCSSTPANRDVSKSYVGKSNWASDATTSMDLAGLLIIEDYLNNDEVIAALQALRRVNCARVTIGQYLRPSLAHIPVERYCSLEEYKEFEIIAKDLGFSQVRSGPLVRSSYHAGAKDS
jgi:hypothetical protein